VDVESMKYWLSLTSLCTYATDAHLIFTNFSVALGTV